MRRIALLLLVAGLVQAQTKLNGRWWKRASQDSRTGVSWGLCDCLEADKGKKLPKLSALDIAQQVDRYYRTHPVDTPLETVMRGLVKSGRKIQPGGEDFSKEKHGWFNGPYWEAGPSEDEEKGFVLGYVSCR